MMEDMISAFPDQLEEAIDIGSKADIKKGEGDIKHILICGMGGSGIGGEFMRSWLSDRCPLPILVNKNYTIPSYVGKSTLAIVSSYSGNTEETLSAVESLLEKQAQLVVVSSGGELIEKAKKLNLPAIELPAGYTSPRACLGYSIIAQLFALHKMGYTDDSFIKELKAGKEQLEKDGEQIKEKAEHIAQILSTRIPVIYSAESLQAVTLRWKQQFNENAKMLCWNNSFPELNHNELVGWKGGNERMAVVVLRNKDDHTRTQMRMNISKEIISHSAGTYMEIWSKGNSLIEQSLYLIHLGDWVSYYLSIQRGEDAVEVKVIDYLKSELAKI